MSGEKQRGRQTWWTRTTTVAEIRAFNTTREVFTHNVCKSFDDYNTRRRRHPHIILTSGRQFWVKLSCPTADAVTSKSRSILKQFSDVLQNADLVRFTVHGWRWTLKWSCNWFEKKVTEWLIFSFRRDSGSSQAPPIYALKTVVYIPIFAFGRFRFSVSFEPAWSER
jgi:hypothetical protein